MSNENETLRDWWTDSTAIEQLMAVAEDLDALYHNDYVVAIGASFAWPVYALGKEREARGDVPNVAVQPFSSGFFMPTKSIEVSLPDNPIALDETNTQLFTEYKEEFFFYPSEKDMHNFRNRLSRSGLSPADIISRHEQTGERTVFVDSVLSGNGMISFYSVMHKWAEEEGLLGPLADAVHFHAYDRHGAFDPQYIESIQGIGNIALPMTRHRLTDDQEHMLQHMISDNRMGPESSRMTPYMEVTSQSLNKSPVFSRNEGVWNDIRDTIEAAI